MVWVRQYSAPNVVGARKLKALIFNTINPLLYEKRSLCVFATYAVHLRLIRKLVVDFLLVTIELFRFSFVKIDAPDRQTNRQTQRCVLFSHGPVYRQLKGRVIAALNSTRNNLAATQKQR